MVAIKDAAEQFLRVKRIAVAGVSRNPPGHGANAVFAGLRARGYDVVPVNPQADEVEGTTCYRSLAEIPAPVDAVVVATHLDQAESLVRECEQLGIRHVWLHKSIGGSSVSQAAVDFGRTHGLQVIPGGCPLMFGKDADRGHKVLRVFCRMTGAVPRQVY
jgi:predicted CoA-binding protein